MPRVEDRVHRVDEHLPGLDAASVARLVRAHETRTGAAMMLVAQVAGPSETRRNELREAGIDAILEKPLDLDDLAWTFTRLCHGQVAARGSGAA